MSRTIAAALAVLLLAGCNKGPTAPSAPPVAACQANNTAQIRFENRSRGTTHDIVLNGSKIATVAPGFISAPNTITAGVVYRVEFAVTNTNLLACQPLFPNLPRCSDEVFFCAFP